MLLMCLNMLSHASQMCHAATLQESWNPMWTVSSILTGLLSFMLEDQITTGSLQSTVWPPFTAHNSPLSYNPTLAAAPAQQKLDSLAAWAVNS